MNQKIIRVLLVDNNKEFCAITSSYLSKQADIQVIGESRDGLDAYKKILMLKPDVVVMDNIVLKLDMATPSEKRRIGQQSPYGPLRCTLTAILQENVALRPAYTQNEYYDAKQLALPPLLAQIRQVMKTNRPNHRVTVAAAQSKAAALNLESRVMHILHEIGVPAHIRGYYYIRAGIILAVDNTEVLNHLTKELYPAIAEQCATTPTRVERAIRHAIDVAWNRNMADSIDSIFGYTISKRKGKPTNGEFIALIAAGLRSEFMMVNSNH